MNFIPYNSRKDYHKSVFGAVSTDTEIIFRIVLPRELNCKEVHLVLTLGEQKQSVLLQWECMQGEHEEWWRCSFTPKKEGLYFYHFTYTTPWGNAEITCCENSNGQIGSGGSQWQLTVYKNDFTTPKWIKGGIIYQIFPDRFNCSDKKDPDEYPGRILRNDWGGIPEWKPDENGKIKNNDYFCGDLKGIEKKLDYLEGLGVSCIYLNPVFHANSNHRYDTADYEIIDPLLGTEADFKRLCKKAKEKGISIILDGVFSHTGNDSKYFNQFGNYASLGAYQSTQSPYFDWFKFNSWPDDYKCWWDIKILPEIVEENESFLEYMTGENSIASKWLRCGAKGWRLDVVDELPDVFLDRFYKAVKDADSQAIVIGEVWEDASNKSSYSHRRRYLLGDQLDSVMNYPFCEALMNFVKFANAESFAQNITTILENYPKEVVDTLMNHIGTHDTARAITRLASDGFYRRERSVQSQCTLSDNEYENGITFMKMITGLQFTLPGVPSIYYGDEAGMQGGSDPFNRGCFVWGSENERLLSHYRTLGKIRREYDAFVDGDFHFISSILGCVCFERNGKSSTIAVISNSNSHDISYELPSHLCDLEVLTGEEKSENKVIIGAKSTAILGRKIYA